MTLEEAKKILESEGFDLLKTDKLGSGTVSEAFTEYENPEICEAMQTVYCAGYKICMFSWRFDERKARLKMECEKNTKTPGPGEEQPKEKKGIIYPTTFPKADFYYKHVLNESNPALKEAASQFNDALLDEQAKKIKRLGKEIARLNKNIYKKNMKIEELRKESSRHLRGKIKMFGENVDLEQMLKDKDAVLADVAEELRLSKIREKNLTEVCQKYMKENEELKKELDAFKESYKRRIKEDSEHFEHIQKICNVSLEKWLIESEYLEKDKPFRFPNYDIASGKTKAVGVDIAEEGADLTGVIIIKSEK